ncbi:hypothetical protein GTA08_BOTSDO01546 [Botryosphaeria dothidea]|uniref:Uncharacterized protein n=1 Tax=Botryosphaeria dothidea TaxID=55169 RepID=A0A8H4J7D1_9PEZI|nr:hypothetical protein GTA08_BOTSDO01546 [Botryosphaeria dothidea]
MSTAEHPSGQWSCVSPWENTLISWKYDQYDVEVVFRHGVQEFCVESCVWYHPFLRHALDTEDEMMVKALKGVVFHQILRDLDPELSRLQKPGQISQRLSWFFNHLVDPKNIANWRAFPDDNLIRDIPYDNPSMLPLYNWNHFRVLEAFRDGLKVQAEAGTIAETLTRGEVYGCILFKDKQLAADGAYHSYLEALVRLTKDAEKGKFDEPDSGYYFVVPRLRAFLRTDDYSTSAMGFLFSWINSWTKAPCLSQLSPNDIRNGESANIYRSCYRLFRAFERLGYAVVAEGRAEDVLDMVGLTPTGQAFIRLPDLGTFVKTLEPADSGLREPSFSFFRGRNDDAVALERILSFLGSGGSHQSPLSPFSVDKGLRSLRPQPQNHLEKLPQELLDRILDLLLLRPSVYCTKQGFYASPPLETALFETSKRIRHSALLRFVRNSFVVQHSCLQEFLDRCVGINNPAELTRSNTDYWASVQHITLLVTIDASYEWDLADEVDSWEESGRALCELLRKKKGDKADQQTKVTLAFLDTPESYPEGYLRPFFRTCRHFKQFASIEIQLCGSEDYEYGDGRRLEKAYEFLEEESRERAEGADAESGQERDA